MSFYIDVIILLIVVFLIFNRLKSVLGTRPEIKITKETKISEEDAAKLFDLIVKEAENQNKEQKVSTSEELTGVDAALVKIPEFDKELFLNGAKRAFEIIIMAFSKGDIETLEGLVNKNLIKKFQDIIEHRAVEGIEAETDLIGFEKAEIVDAKVSKTNIAKIVVNFISEQVNILKNAKGEIIEGDENFIQKISDIWTFERNITSANPNWILVSTKKK